MSAEFTPIDVGGASIRRWLLHRLLWSSVRNSKITLDRIDELRRENDRRDRRFNKLDPQLQRTRINAGGANAEWIDAPESSDRRILFYVHGGAFCLSFPNLHAALAGRWCRRLGARALMVDYRLAPEHPHPAALDDCLTAYRFLLDQGISAGDVVVAGDSAGANLALALLQQLARAGLGMPRCAVLLSPVVDFTLSSTSLFENAGRDPMFTFQRLAELRLLYAKPEQFLDPAVSPLYGDFTGLPPLLFQAGEIEMLRDESVRAAARARAAGVNAEVQVWRHMAHVFQALPLPQAAAAEARLLEFIGQHTGWNIAATQSPSR